MRFLLSFLLISFINFSCTSNDTEASKDGVGDRNYGMELHGDGSFTVSGEIAGASGKDVYLQTYPLLSTSRDQEVNVVDTATIGEDGSFALQGKVDHKTFGMVAMDNERAAYLVLDGTDYTLQATYDNFANYKLSGNPEAKIIKNFFNILRSHYNAINNARSDVQVARGNKESQERIDELAESEYRAMDTYFSFVEKFTDTTSSPLVAMFAVTMLEPALYSDIYESLLEKYESVASGSPYYERLEKRAGSSGGMIGETAPDIRLPDPDGDTMALSDLRGNYVLLDFWAAWCKPCRRENPNLVRLYNEFSDENFRIFSVSLDRNKSDWTKAIEADKLTWDTHVSELAFWQTEAIKPYGVNSIPATFLVNPEGKIIAKDLRGFMLEKKLRQLFEED